MMTKIAAALMCLIFFTQTHAAESSVYEFSWLDKDKEIYVLQNRKFRKDGKLYLSLSGVKTLSGAFVDSYGAQGRVGYFFRENWGFEFVYGKSSGEKNETAKSVEQQGSVPFYRKIDSYMAGMVVWSPFYSKINTFNQIFYFDWMFGLGAASVKTLDNRKSFVPPINENKTLTDGSSTGLIWNTALRFYISEHWSLRLDFTGLHYKTDKSDEVNVKVDSTASNYDFAVGLSYAF